MKASNKNPTAVNANWFSVTTTSGDSMKVNREDYNDDDDVPVKPVDICTRLFSRFVKYLRDIPKFYRLKNNLGFD